MLLAVALMTLSNQSLALESPTRLDINFDWILFADIKTENDFLKYPTSQLNPLTIVKVTQRMTAKSDTPSEKAVTTVFPYEDFWYHDGTVVGLRRHKNLSCGEDTTGAIVVQLNSSESHKTRAMTNAIIRLCLEQYLANNAVAGIYVPDQTYNQVVAELARFNFLPEMKVEDGPQLPIKLISYPAGNNEYFYFQKNTAF